MHGDKLRGIFSEAGSLQTTSQPGDASSSWAFSLGNTLKEPMRGLLRRDCKREAISAAAAAAVKQLARAAAAAHTSNNPLAISSSTVRPAGVVTVASDTCWSRT